MNILAHGYLSTVPDSPITDDLLVGNFLGDFIKGDPAHPRHELTPGVITGIHLHRAIDTFTDTHPDVALVRDRLHPRCHKYAGVAVDVFFDHFLARHFTELTGQTLALFTDYYYKTLCQYIDNQPTLFSEPARRMLTAMNQYRAAGKDWITSYAVVEGINQSLRGIARRTSFPSGLETAVVDLETYYDEFDAAFRRFWPELVGHVAQQPATPF
jgi:acyl carrier protein phosphodiesterase